MSVRFIFADLIGTHELTRGADGWFRSRNGLSAKPYRAADTPPGEIEMWRLNTPGSDESSYLFRAAPSDFFRWRLEYRTPGERSVVATEAVTITTPDGPHADRVVVSFEVHRLGGDDAEEPFRTLTLQVGAEIAAPLVAGWMRERSGYVGT
jgi:hypothetical protein